MLKALRDSVKAEKKDESIFDIVVYGSVVKGAAAPRDIDIAVIFRSGALRERLNRVQEIKRKITGKVDMKGILLEELFKPEFFARSGIFIEGISLFDGKRFSRKIGFDSSAVFKYNMKDKSHTEKVKFNYVLSGRNSEGVLDALQGKHIAPGVVEVPVEMSLEFEDVLRMHKIKFSKTMVLKQI